jgi:septal ring factor EnvC (AmiA/AmiB activator)
MSKTENERNRLQDEFDQIQSEGGDFDLSKHLARPEDLPDLGEIEIYDYDSDLTVASQQSMEVLESLVDLYLSDIPQLKEHPYIKNKMKEDAMVYSETIFLTKMTRKNFLSQLRQVDNGDNSARMHEVVNQTIGQIRENAKFLSTQRTDLEKFYKNLRKDLCFNEIENTELNKSLADEASDNQSGPTGDIMDNRKLNDLIKTAMLSKDKDSGKS